MNDDFFMQEALAEARLALDAGEIPVGCVVVRNGEIIGRGHNEKELSRLAYAHAEMKAMEDACRAIGNWRLEGCDLYATLEPCIMCAGAILEARIGRVIFGAPDERAGACGGFINLSDVPGYPARFSVSRGVSETLCSDILSIFFQNMRCREK